MIESGQVGWGISWYINGLLVPEIYVVIAQDITTLKGLALEF